MRFQGKVAIWVWIIFFGGNLLCMAGIIDPDEESLAVMIVILLFYNVIILPMLIRNYVLLDEEKLTVYFGFSKESIMLKEICEVYRTHDPMATSAASLDRIVISNRHKKLICSVCDRQGLFAELKRRNPKILFR